MSDSAPACPDCQAPYSDTDNYCRQCGMYVAALRDTAIIPAAAALPARVERERAQLPAPVKKAVTAVAIGTALQVGMSITGKYLARQAANSAVNAVRPTRGKAPRAERAERASKGPAKEVTVPQQAAIDPYPEAAAVSETVVIRRVWIRRS
jgi:hypothetical protein